MSMNFLFFNFLTTTIEATTQPTNVNDMSNIIGFGGIIATVLVGIITCIVTWKLTRLSIKQKKLNFSFRILNILSNSLNMQHNALGDLTITLGDKKLKNPCLLLIEIENTGNEAIHNPPICIRVDNKTEIIPGYIQNIPAGYESKWSLKKTSDNSCNILLEHINSKQTVKACFFLDNTTNKVSFECPMPDIVIHEKSDHTSENHTVFKGRFGRIEKVTSALLISLVLLVISTELWAELLYYIFSSYAPLSGVLIFIFSVLILSILLNVFGIKKFDKFIYKHKKSHKWIFLCSSWFISALLVYMILFNILISNFFIQTIIAGIVVVLLSLTIHILSIEC